MWGGRGWNPDDRWWFGTNVLFVPIYVLLESNTGIAMFPGPAKLPPCRLGGGPRLDMQNTMSPVAYSF